mgnify:CR=1 FL=1
MKIEELQKYLCGLYPDLCPLFSVEFGDGILQVESDQLHAAAADLAAIGFDMLGMVTAVDYGEEFELVYRIRSREMRVGIIVRTRLPRIELRRGAGAYRHGRQRARGYHVGGFRRPFAPARIGGRRQLRADRRQGLPAGPHGHPGRHGAGQTGVGSA